MSQSSTSTVDSSSKASVKTRKSLEQLENITFVGNVSHQITGSKLPSLKQVLQVLFYNMRFAKLGLKESAKLTIDAASIYWHQAKIPIREEHKCVDKLVKVYNHWQKLKKNVPEKRSDTKKKDIETFIDSLDDLFDISTSDALETMKIDEDRKFLEMQRQKGRPGCMVGVDMVLFERERRAQERKEKEEMRKRKHQEEMTRQHGNFRFD